MIIKCWTVWKAVTAKPATSALVAVRRVRRVRRAATWGTQMVPTIVCTVVGLAGLPGDAAQIGGHNQSDAFNGGTNGTAHAAGYRDSSQLGRDRGPDTARVDRPPAQAPTMKEANMSNGYHDTGMAIISGHQPHDAGTTTHHPTLDTQPHVTAVPEPSSFIILAAALTLAMLLRLRNTPAARCSPAPRE